MPSAETQSHRSAIIFFLPGCRHMDDEILSIRIPAEAFMDELPTLTAGSRRNEDIALDLMKFIAMTTGYGRTTSSGVGCRGGAAASQPEESAGHLPELYTKCWNTAQQEHGGQAGHLQLTP